MHTISPGRKYFLRHLPQGLLPIEQILLQHLNMHSPGGDSEEVNRAVSMKQTFYKRMNHPLVRTCEQAKITLNKETQSLFVSSAGLMTSPPDKTKFHTSHSHKSERPQSSRTLSQQISVEIPLVLGLTQLSSAQGGVYANLNPSCLSRVSPLLSLTLSLLYIS